MWIIRVYFLMAIIAPILMWLANKLKNTGTLVFMAIVYMGYEIILSHYHLSFGITDIVVQYILFYLIAYGGIYLLGILMQQIRGIHILTILCGIIMLAFIIVAVKEDFGNINAYKFPPRIYYLLYGMLISVTLYLITGIFYKQFSFCGSIPIIQWISKESLTIYFWHVFILKLVEIYAINFLLNHWMIYLFFLVTVSMLLTYLHRIVLRMFKRIYVANKR